jgi:serine/threonine protein kinase
MNVLIDDNGDLVLCDFGIARILKDLSGEMDNRGTVRWQSPEVLIKERKTKASDMWAWACLVLEASSESS